jgi:ketosteroid isomerase-like protein
MAYSTGTDRISFTTPDGKSVTQENRAIAIWKKQADGSWKCVVDVMNPAEPPAAK